MPAVNPSRFPDIGSLPSDWEAVDVRPLRFWFRRMEGKPLPNDHGQPMTFPPGFNLRALAARVAMLSAMSDLGVVVTDEVITAMATRPMSQATTLEELIAEFRAG